jgi:Rrf2 family protein
LNTFLSQTAEYALRVMTLLARHEPGEPLLTRDLSLESGIPAQYLSKILRRLVLAGLLESQKGRGGGFVLSRAPAEITFREVLTAVDAFPREDRCAFGWGKCDPSHACPLHSTWTGMSAHFQHWASTSTFDDVRGSSRRKPAVRARARAPRRSRTR